MLHILYYNSVSEECKPCQQSPLRQRKVFWGTQLYVLVLVLAFTYFLDLCAFPARYIVQSECKIMTESCSAHFPGVPFQFLHMVIA